MLLLVKERSRVSFVRVAVLLRRGRLFEDLPTFLKIYVGFVVRGLVECQG